MRFLSGLGTVQGSQVAVIFLGLFSACFFKHVCIQDLDFSLFAPRPILLGWFNGHKLLSPLFSDLCEVGARYCFGLGTTAMALGGEPLWIANTSSQAWMSAFWPQRMMPFFILSRLALLWHGFLCYNYSLAETKVNVSIPLGLA